MPKRSNHSKASQYKAYMKYLDGELGFTEIMKIFKVDIGSKLMSKHYQAVFEVEQNTVSQAAEELGFTNLIE